MAYKDPEYKRKYYLKNKDSILAREKQRYLRNKDQIFVERKKLLADRNRDFRKNLLAQFPCLICGESDPDMIDWHHVNEEDKLFNIADTSRAMGDWWEEVLKCIPVCVSCHRKIHKGKLCLLPQSL